jgi:CHRD domain
VRISGIDPYRKEGKRMKKLAAATVLVLVASLGVATLALGAARATEEVHANLTAKADHATGAPHAKGSFVATLKGTKLTWKLTFSGLSGPAAAAHIHKGKAGVSGPVVVPLCAPCKSGQHSTAKLSASMAKTLSSGGFYVNVHTAKNPNGEIRGQIAAGM